MIGRQVGNFVIIEKIGHGGMGEVFLAEQKSIKTKVAIKTLHPHVSENKAHVQRFFNEAIAVSRIKHSGIAKIFDVGFFDDSGQAYLVMEFLEGESLAQRVRRVGVLTVQAVADICRQISSVLEATQQAGITHRDLKPDNVYLVSDAELESGERVKILDFGIAKLGGTGLTSTSGGAMGTPMYMAPEQWKNTKQVDWRADAYSLGCLGFEIATGRPPFICESMAEACAKHLTETAPAARTIVPTLPASLDTIFARLLEKEPDQRPPTLKDITKTFSRALEEANTSSTQLGVGPGSNATAAVRTPVPPVERATPPPTPALPMIAKTTPIQEPRPVTAAVRAAVAQSPSELIGHTTLAGASGAVTTSRPSQSKLLSRRVLGILVALGVLSLGAIIAVAIIAMGRRDATPSVASNEAKGSEARSPMENAAGPGVAGEPTVTPIASPDASLPAVPPATEATQPALNADVGGSGSVATAQKKNDSRAAPLQKTSSRSAGSEGGGCDEVSCVLNNYDGSCCLKFKKAKAALAAAKAAREAAIAAGEPPPPGTSSLDRDMISAGINNVKLHVQRCGDFSPAKGKVKVKVVVSPDGEPSQVSVETTPDPALGSCVAAAVQKARFPKTDLGGSFSYPFVF